MTRHSENIFTFRKPIATGLVGLLLFLTLFSQGIYWYKYSPTKPVTIYHDGKFPEQSHHFSSKYPFEIYPNVALRILKAIGKNPKIQSLQQLEQLTHFDSLTIMNTLNSAVLKKSNTNYRINLNEADSAEFEALPGIGAKLAGRIIKYRSRLGGFFSKYQLWEIKYLDSQWINSENIDFYVFEKDVKRIPINDCSIKRLYQHPYIGKAYASLLYNFQKQHAPLTEILLRDIKSIPKEALNRIMPYLEFRPTTK